MQKESNNIDARSRKHNIFLPPKGDPENTSSKNYFSMLADKYSKASHILYIALVVCFVFTLIFNSKILTYNNFNYLFKDINAAAEIASSNYNSISYTNDTLRVTKGFRGGIITASTTDMAIYSATGKKSLHINENFVFPQIAVSSKYAIIYDYGGNNYSVYNSFSRVHNAKTSHPISLITVAENGWFAIVSKNNDHTSAVYLYDNDFNLRNSYLFATKYVFSVSINNECNRIAIIGTESAPSGDGFITSVMIYKPGTDTSKAEITLGNCMPYGSAFSDKETLNVVCSDGMYVLNENSGQFESKFEFNMTNARRISISSDGCAISFADNDSTVNNILFVFDEKGALIYQTHINGGISDIEYIKGNVFIGHNDAITKIDIEKSKETTVNIFENGTDIIVYDANNILLCCQTKAKYIEF